MRPKGRIVSGAALATGVAVAAAAAPAGGATPARHLAASSAASAGASAATGSVLGGLTPQSWPIVIALNKARTRVAQVVIGLDLTCTSGDSFSTNDGFQNIKLSKRGRFSASIGPERIDAGGVPADVDSKVIGRFRDGRSSMRGIWSLKVTIYDATGTTVTDTCESGVVSWTAVQ